MFTDQEILEAIPLADLVMTTKLLKQWGELNGDKNFSRQFLSPVVE